jgi:hypothetical protein
MWLVKLYKKYRDRRLLKKLDEELAKYNLIMMHHTASRSRVKLKMRIFKHLVRQRRAIDEINLDYDEINDLYQTVFKLNKRGDINFKTKI